MKILDILIILLLVVAIVGALTVSIIILFNICMEINNNLITILGVY